MTPKHAWPAKRDNGRPNTPHEFQLDPETQMCVICGWAEQVHRAPAHPKAWDDYCACGHSRLSHPFGLSEALILDGSCAFSFCDCEGFTDAGKR